jgi:predicted DNA-binding transcriptional regulator AlpA
MPPADSIPDNAILLDAAGVCHRPSIGISHLHALRRAGRFPLMPVRLGRAVRFRADELSRWVSAGCPAADRWRAMNMGRKGAA